MRATQEHRFPFLIIGVGLGLLARFLWSLRAGEETRDQPHPSADGGLEILPKETEKVRAGANRWVTRLKEYFRNISVQIKRHVVAPFAGGQVDKSNTRIGHDVSPGGSWAFNHGIGQEPCW